MRYIVYARNPNIISLCHYHGCYHPRYIGIIDGAYYSTCKYHLLKVR